MNKNRWKIIKKLKSLFFFWNGFSKLKLVNLFSFFDLEKDHEALGWSQKNQESILKEDSLQFRKSLPNDVKKIWE